MAVIRIIVGHTPTKKGAKSPPLGEPPVTLTEWDVNRPIGRRVVTILSRVYGHKQTGLISGNISLTTKADRANHAGAKVVVELHCNAATAQATGTETLYESGDAESRKLAEYLQGEVVELLGLADRGVKPRKPNERGGYILQRIKGAAAITEPLFLSNPGEAILLKYPALREELAQAYARGIHEYVAQLET